MKKTIHDFIVFRFIEGHKHIVYYLSTACQVTVAEIMCYEYHNTDISETIVRVPSLVEVPVEAGAGLELIFIRCAERLNVCVALHHCIKTRADIRRKLAVYRGGVLRQGDRSAHNRIAPVGPKVEGGRLAGRDDICQMLHDAASHGAVLRIFVLVMHERVEREAAVVNTATVIRIRQSRGIRDKREV